MTQESIDISRQCLKFHQKNVFTGLGKVAMMRHNEMVRQCFRKIENASGTIDWSLMSIDFHELESLEQSIGSRKQLIGPKENIYFSEKERKIDCKKISIDSFILEMDKNFQVKKRQTQDLNLLHLSFQPLE